MTSRAPEHERHNRAFWNADADAYQEVHGDQLKHGKKWGVWAIPESDLGALGPTRDLDVLEYGAGGAQWSVALAQEGARVIGLDVSEAQLRHAVTNASTAGVTVPVVCASGEAVPLRAESFDVVFCDHGAMTFCDPHHSVPEVARLLRSGGVLVFNHSTPLTLLTDGKRKLKLAFDEIRRVTWPEGTSEFQLGHGEWIKLFRSHGCVVEDLIELRAPEGATTTYDDYVSYEWARKWPAEQIWRVRKL